MRPLSLPAKHNTALLGLFCLVFSGCLGAFAFPEFSYIPGKDLEEDWSQIHVFRIDSVDSLHQRVEGDMWTCDPASEHSFREVPLGPGGHLDAQSKASIFYSWFAGFAGHSTFHGLTVRMYRPGFQTVEIKGWLRSQSIKWQPAKDLAEEEKAIDDLLLSRFRINDSAKDDETSSNEAPKRDLRRYFDHLIYEPTTEAHRKAILFAVAEYERLANRISKSDSEIETRSRLLGKANFLRNNAIGP